MNKHILNLLLAASMTMSAVGFAQTETAVVHASPVAAPTYLGLGYVQGALQVSTSSTSAANLSPEVQTIAFKDGQRPAGFEALHTNTTLSEVVSYYWEALSEFGFTTSVDATSGDSVRYSFENGASRLVAVFTQDDDAVLADLSWIGVELASTAN